MLPSPRLLAALTYATAAALALPALATADIRDFAQGNLCFCQGMGVDGQGSVYVSDPNTSRLHKFTPVGDFVTTIASGGGLVLSAPFDSTALPNGNLAIAGAGVKVITPSGTFVRDLPLPNSRGVAADPAGNVYAVNGSSVTRWQPDESVTTWSAPGHPFNQLESIAYSGLNGHLYVVDGGNHQVYELTTNGVVVREFGGFGDGGDQLNSPSGVAVDADGNVYVTQPNLVGTNSATVIKKFTASGALVSTYSYAGQPYRLARFGDFLYVSAFTKVTRIDLRRPIASMAGSTTAKTGQALTFDAGSSSLPFGTITAYDWDLDGDGSYETSSGAMSRATRRFTETGSYAVGLRVTGSTGATDTLTTVVNVERSSASLSASGNPALTDSDVVLDATRSELASSDITDVRFDADGDGSFETQNGTGLQLTRRYSSVGTRMVGVEVTRPGGVVDVARVPLEVRAKPPASATGVSINGGDRFTNDPNVTLRLSWPVLSLSALLSNDGGFGSARMLAVAPGLTWKLDSSGPERLPKTVYVRFDDRTQTFQDDIILDETAPTLKSARLAPSGGRPRAAAAAARRPARRFAVRIQASDRTSGVRFVQTATNRRKPHKPRRFTSTLRGKGAAPKYVRVYDWAGNRSRWLKVRRARARR